MRNPNYVVIMAGGVGSRFWPISRNAYPKQFLDILGIGKTLIQQTFHRFEKLIPIENIFVITADDYIDIVKEQLPLMSEENILGEPCRKNTAPCIAYLATKLLKMDPQAVLIVAPADHLILNEPTFLEICNQALHFTINNPSLLTLGITPTYANTGYGYIQRTETEVSPSIYKVKRFTEKPDLETAKGFIDSGDFLWNAGIFVWKAETILAAFQQYLPDLYDAFMACWDMYGTPAEKQAVDAVYQQCRSVSVDVGIMEHADNVYIYPSSFGWSDLGTWTSAWENMPKDDQHNAVSGNSVVIIDASKCVVHAPHKKTVVVQGLDNFIVVDTKDALLICSKEREQDIKQYVELLKVG